MNKYLVAQVDNREKVVAKLKARLYGHSIDELVKQAINRYEVKVDSIDCPHCFRKMLRKKVEKETTCTVAGNDYTIRILNYPKDVCGNCGTEYDDLDVSVYTEELMRNELMGYLKRGKLPNSLDFNQLIQIGHTN